MHETDEHDVCLTYHESCVDMVDDDEVEIQIAVDATDYELIDDEREVIQQHQHDYIDAIELGDDDEVVEMDSADENDETE